MRPIKFRGISKATGQWVYGFYTRNVFGDHLIVTQNYYPDGSVRFTNSFIVIPETVGQFTGLKDSVGNEI